jgi:hypothetical protein
MGGRSDGPGKQSDKAKKEASKKKPVKAAIPIIVGLAVIMFTSSPKQKGFLGYYSNLRPGPKGGVRER